MPKLFSNALGWVRDARWLTRQRLLLWGAACALLSIALFARDALVYPSTGVMHGGDFNDFWSSIVLAANGSPKSAYAATPDHPLDQTLTYPPSVLLLWWPLAGLSYGHALLAWVLLGTALFGWSLARLVGWEMAIPAAIGTPAAFWNVLGGQNGAFTAVILAWGLILVERRPVAAGALLGLLCCKPQLAVLLPVALAAGRHWAALAAAAGCAALLAVLSALLFGPDVWIAFFDRLVLQRGFMEISAPSWIRMPSVFAMVRLAGSGLPGAYLIQAVSTAAAAAAAAFLWRRGGPLGVKSAGLAIGMFLATPYAWDYDMVALLFAAAWLGNEGRRTGFRSWEKISILVLLTLPALSPLPALKLHLQIAPLLLWLVLAVVSRRGLAAIRPQAVAAARPPVRGMAPFPS